jgi:hypothetical protein
MLDNTTFRIAQQEYSELARRRPVAEGVRIEEVGILRRGLVHLGGLLVAAGQRLQGPAGPVSTRSTAVGSGD